MTNTAISVGGKVDPFAVNKADLSRAFLATTAFLDASGYCLFNAFHILDIPSGMEGMVESAAGVLGTDWKVEDITKIGMEILKMERAFNAAAGFTAAHDRLPDFMTYEKLPPHNTVFDVSAEELDKVYGA